MIITYLIVKFIKKSIHIYFLSFLNLFFNALSAYINYYTGSECVKSYDTLEGGFLMLITMTLMGTPKFVHNSLVLIINVGISIFFAL